MQVVADGLARGQWIYKIALAILLPLGLVLAIFVILTTPAVSPAVPSEIICGDLHMTNVVLYDNAPLSRFYDVVGLIGGKSAHIRVRPANCILLFGENGVQKPADKLPQTEELPQQPPPAVTPDKPNDYSA